MNRLAHACILGFDVLFVIFLTSCNSSQFNSPNETIAATSGSSQSAAVNTAFAAPLVATVMIGGAPVSGAFVIFTAPASGASGTFASNSTNTETDTTNASGVATSSVFTANGTVGAQTVTASLAAATASVSFSLTNTSGAPASIAETSGTLQDATISTAFGAPLQATVVDSNSNPVSGASVTFAAPISGASGTFASNSSSTETDMTDSGGVATSSVFTANATAGAYAVMAAVSGVTAAASFSLTNITGATVSITETSGTPQTTAVNAAFAAPLVVTVVDSGQNPLPGVQVTFHAPTVGAGIAGNAISTATTNANGVATSQPITANGSVGTYTVAATVASGAEPANFVLTNTPLKYAFYLSGLEVASPPNFYALAGSVTLDGNGNVLGGEQDFNDGIGNISPQPSGDTILPGSNALVVDPTTGQGTLTLTTNNANLGASGVETLAVQFVNTKHAMIVQFDGTATSSGSMDLQNFSSTLNDGNYAFILSGVDTSDLSIVYGGVFSISNSGTSLQGTYDVDDSGATTTPVLGTAFTGTITEPDASGRGTITTTTLPISSLNYYVVGPEAIRIIDVDTSTDDSAVGSAFGQGAGTFSNASLVSSIFGVESNADGNLYAAAGQFSPSSGTFTGVADDNEYSNAVIAAQAPITGTYAVAGNGYGSFKIAAGDLGDLSVFGIYMTDPSLNLIDPNNTTTGLGGALVADLDGVNLNGTGVMIPQTDTSTASFAGNYAFGAQTYNVPRTGYLGWEFDFVGQGSVDNSVLTGAAGLLSDPFAIFNQTGQDGTDTATFSGTASPDNVYPGRYTMKLGIAVAADPNYTTAIYQADGGQLFWLDEDANGKSVFLGSLQQQGSLTGLSAAQGAQKINSTGKPRQQGPQPGRVTR
jgi:hypothetical protein